MPRFYLQSIVVCECIWIWICRKCECTFKQIHKYMHACWYRTTEWIRSLSIRIPFLGLHKSMFTHALTSFPCYFSAFRFFIWSIPWFVTHTHTHLHWDREKHLSSQQCQKVCWTFVYFFLLCVISNNIRFKSHSNNKQHFQFILYKKCINSLFVHWELSKEDIWTSIDSTQIIYIHEEREPTAQNGNKSTSTGVKLIK